MIARDGEGATKLVTVTVRGAAVRRRRRDGRVRDRRLAARQDRGLRQRRQLGSCRHGALGKSGAELDPGRASTSTSRASRSCRDGAAVGFDEDEALAALDAAEVTIEVDLHLGERRRPPSGPATCPTTTCASTGSTARERRDTLATDDDMKDLLAKAETLTEALP